ncbi:NAD(P)-binding domain-containing protein, partial [Burkholderia territorii]|uniref:NAD(P)-binding domain-containing protein n=1 Tax=Burkholderia territorii TaxID=1503055 RepID=UPI002012870F
MEIAFIGLGNMGGPMAANLLKAGHALTVFDLDKNAVDTAVHAGATAAASQRDAAARASLVITMLPAAQHVREVYLGDDGVLAGARAGATFVDCSTIDPFSYPKDPRLDMNDYQRGQHFGQLALVNGTRMLVATGQN